MWAKISFGGEYLVPVEDLKAFENFQRVESKYISSDAEENTTGRGYYTHWMSKNPALPNVELISNDQYKAMKVLGAMGGMT